VGVGVGVGVTPGVGVGVGVGVTPGVGVGVGVTPGVGVGVGVGNVGEGVGVGNVGEGVGVGGGASCALASLRDVTVRLAADSRVTVKNRNFSKLDDRLSMCFLLTVYRWFSCAGP
jgi:hypothetical protein